MKVPIDAIVLHDKDNVGTAVQELTAGQQAVIRRGQDLVRQEIVQDIPYGHKFALKNIQTGEDICKYGEVIGRATREIPAGGHAHVQNIESLRGRGDLGGGA